MIGIRADGNDSIGLGHVMRCLSIADKLRESGEQIIFYLADPYPVKLVEARGYKTVLLASEANNMEQELPEFSELLRKADTKLLLIDSYYVTPGYLKTLKTVVRTAYIDDLNAFPLEVNMLINYSIYGKDMEYVRFRDCRYLLGTEYAPLRQQFERQQLPPKADEKRILILSGGTDPFEIGRELPGRILACEKLKEYTLSIVLGGSIMPDQELMGNQRVRFYRNVTAMAELMRTASFAVSAGGSSLYELCACEIPTVTYSFVDNQLGNVQKFNQLEVMPWAGDLRNGRDQVFDKIVEQLTDFSVNEQKFRLAAMEKLVDGKGAERIAEALLSLAHSTSA